MRNKPAQPTTLIFGIIGGIVILSGIGFLIAFALNRVRDVTPTVTEAATCCDCSWSIEIEGERELQLGSTSGVVEGDECYFGPRFPDIGDSISYLEEYVPITCEDIPLDDVFDTPPEIELPEGAVVKANEYQGLCEGGCILNTSIPLLPPTEVTDENSEVTFFAIFELRYAVPPHSEITQAEMLIEYPAEQTSPDPISADSLELLTTYDDNDDPDLPVAIYKASFQTTWDTVINYEREGIYSVKFRYKSDAGSWSSTERCTREFNVAEPADEGKYCYDLDFVPVNGTTPLEVTFTVDAGVEEGEKAAYEWKLDLNCNGNIDPGTGEDAETFTTTDDPSVTRTFTLNPSQSNESSECPVSVNVKLENGARTLQELTPGSCSGLVVLSEAPASCGDGECAEGETCDPNGNIACPSGNALTSGRVCQADCTYCGDGFVNGVEDCDPEVPEGDPDYEELCQNNCTLADEEPADDQPVDDDPGEEPDEPITAGSIVVNQQTPDCLEMVAPNNTTPIIITVSNNNSSSLDIRAVSDTLPKGTTYQTASSTINGTPNTGDTGVTIETSGESQLVTWDNGGTGWTLGSGETLTISFTAIVGPSAVMGAQTNRVIVTPSDDNPIPSEAPILIAQSCTQPLTGIFDRNAVIIFIGSIFLLIAGAAFYTGFGTKQVSFALEGAATVSSSMQNAVKDIYLKLSRPQKYMEKKIERSALKKIQEHEDGSKETSGEGKR